MNFPVGARCVFLAYLEGTVVAEENENFIVLVKVPDRPVEYAVAKEDVLLLEKTEEKDG